MDLEQKQIERRFDRAAATYDSVAQVQRQMADRLLKELPESLAGRLVDLGCGTGELLSKLSDRSCETRLTGIDLSAAMLTEARKRNPHVSFLKGDLISLPFDDKTFDWVVSNAAIQWCDSLSAFHEIRRVLRSGGHALLSTFGPSTMLEWRGVLAAAGSGAQKIHSFKRIDTLADELAQAGFKDVTLSSETVELEFDSVREMFDSVRKLGATNARHDRSPGLTGKQWLNRVTQEFEKRRKPSGKLSLTYECYFLFAK